MAGQERDPRAYELMTIFLPDMPEEENQTQLDKVSGYISNAGGSVKEVLTSSPWGRRRLAYPIRFNDVDYRDGYYTVYHFDAAPAGITEIERDLKLDTSTMRYLLVHDDPKAGEKFPQQDGENAESEESTEAAPPDAEASDDSANAETATSQDAAETTTSDAAADESVETSDPATTAAAAEETPAETRTEDAVSAEDTAETEPAPEQQDPEIQVPVSNVASGDDQTESEAGTQPTDENEADKE